MPEEGTYKTKQISTEEASIILNNASKLKSSVGYEEVQSLILQYTGIKVPINRAKTVILEDTAIVLIFTIYNDTKLNESLLVNFNGNRYVILLAEYKSA